MEHMCINVCEWKNNTCWNYPKNEGRGVKENGGGGEFKYDILEIL
jgi:hypothetical protein